MDSMTEETIAAIATPPGQGAIALIRVSGKNAKTIAESVFDPLERAAQAVCIAHVTDEIAQLRIFLRRELLAHLVLFQFVARIDDETAHTGVFFEHCADEGASERTGSPGHQNAFVIQQGTSLLFAGLRIGQ